MHISAHVITKREQRSRGEGVPFRFFDWIATAVSQRRGWLRRVPLGQRMADPARDRVAGDGRRCAGLTPIFLGRERSGAESHCESRA